MTRRTKIVVTLGALLLAALVLNTVRLGVGADLRAECTVGSYPDGWASCEFTNMGYVPGRICAAARGARYGGDSVTRSQTLCSGILMPLSTQTVIEPDSAGSFCKRGECAITTIVWP